jgi:hypothetical protein
VLLSVVTTNGWHLLPEQLPGPQLWPHAPQLLLSFVRSKQALPQALVLPEHPQLPDWHTLFVPQDTGPETGFEHVPSAGSQMPLEWQTSLALHTMDFDPVHVPDWHRSVCVQALPSSQTGLSVRGP